MIPNNREAGEYTAMKLTAKMEPFDSFWEGPDNVEKGYTTFSQFYRCNYLKYFPQNKKVNILVVSCGPGYFVHLLKTEGYQNVLGIDSDAQKVAFGKKKELNCQQERAFPFVNKNKDKFDFIFCEQEINHLTKDEILSFLNLCSESLKEKGSIIVHSLNGANPLTGSEALAQNFDHYNTFTEYSLKQILECAQFSDIEVFPLNLYVFYSNPLNYVALLLSKLNDLFFKINFFLYGKKNRFFTKKIGAVAKKP